MTVVFLYRAVYPINFNNMHDIIEASRVNLILQFFKVPKIRIFQQLPMINKIFQMKPRGFNIEFLLKRVVLRGLTCIP